MDICSLTTLILKVHVGLLHPPHGHWPTGNDGTPNADVASNRVEACSYYLPASHEEGSMLNRIYHSSLGRYFLILNYLESALY